MSDAFDPYFKWLGIPKADQPPHAYRLLGIELFESDADVISNAADGRMAQIKSFQTGKFGAVSQKLLNEIAAAKVCLLKPQKKTEYDRRLRAHLQQKSAAANAQVAEPQVAKPQVAETVVTAEDRVADLPFLDYSTAPKRSTTRPAKRAKQPAWLIPAGIGAGAIALLTGVVVYLSGAGDGKGKPANPQTALLAGSNRETRPNQSAKSSDKPAAGTSQSSPKPTGIASTVAEENAHVSVSQPSAAPAPPTPKPETRPKPKIELVAEPERAAPVEKVPEKHPEKAVDNSVAARPPATEKEPAKKPPIPDKEQYQAMNTKIHKVFQKEFAEAKSPDSKLALALAEKLDKQGDASRDDAVERYSLWRIAADEASVAGDFSLVVNIVDKIQAEFDVDGDAVKAEILATGTARTTMTPEAARNLGEIALELAAAATAREDWDAALQFSKLATTAARRTKDPQFSRDVLARCHEIEHLKTRYAVVAKALETLAKEPENADANLAAGQWHCFAKGDWEKGLPCLAKGSREDLAALAKQELAKPADAKDQVAVADAWWALAEKDHGDFKSKFRARAASWYERAAPSLSGLEKTRVAKQIAAAKQESAQPAAAERPARTAHGSYQRGNVALLTNGTTFIGKVTTGKWQFLFDGDSTHYTTQTGYAETETPVQWMVVLGKVYSLRQIRIKFYDLNSYTYRYRIWTSTDGKTYAPLIDRSQGEWRSWQTIIFPARPVKFIKIEGLDTSSKFFNVVEIEAYCVPVDPAQK